jgi:hypothetical protein
VINTSAPTSEEIEAAARAMAQLDNADYFETGNINGMDDYRESAEVSLAAALPLIEARIVSRNR